MWKVNIVNEENGIFLYETFRNTEREIPDAIRSYFANPKLDLEGVTKMYIEKIYIDREKVYRDALEEIAHRPKIDAIDGSDNSVEVEIARTALGLPLDIPEYDNPQWDEKD